MTGSVGDARTGRGSAASRASSDADAGEAPSDDLGELQEGLGLPRAQVGTTPQHLMLTLLGDYWYGRTEHLPSAALVELLTEFGITEAGARSALSRLTRRGLLVSSKDGRNTYYGLSSRASSLLVEGLRRIISFGMEERAPWDGMWTVVVYSVPEAQRSVRHAVRTRLRWVGFAPLSDGVWCSPRDEQSQALEIMADLGIGSATVMRARIDERSPVDPLAAWDLDGVRRKYHEFEKEFLPLLDRARNGSLTASEALVERTKVMDSWRNFPALEPDLPPELLPADWPRAHMRQLFLEVYDSLAPVGEARCRQIVARHSPELAELVTHHKAVESLTVESLG